MSDQKDVNLLLVGRTGNGKSATGNSILGQKLFSSSMNSEPFTEADIRLGTRTDGHRHIYVVDGPGIGDSSLDDPKGVKTTISLTETAFQRLAEFSNGFNAVLLVLKYGERFTTQEKDAVRMLKGILGSRVLENHGVVVMTRGDNFENDQEEDGLCFEDWCRHQTGEVAAIFQECKGRIVLFDNRTKTETKLEKQREELLKHVERLGRYTKQDYDKAEEDRRRLRLASEFDTREKKTMAFVDKTTAEINKLDISGNPNDAEKKIIVLQDKLNAHRQELQEETRGTDMATRLQLLLDILSLSLGNKLEMASRTLELQEIATKNRRQRENNSSKGSKNKERNMDLRLVILMLWSFTLSPHFVLAADEPCDGVAEEGADYTMTCRLPSTTTGLLWQVKLGNSFVNVSSCSRDGVCTNSMPGDLNPSLVNDSGPAGGYLGRLRILNVNRTRNKFKCVQLDFTHSQTCNLQVYVKTQKPTCQEPSLITIGVDPYLQVTCASDSVYPEGNCSFDYKGLPRNISTRISLNNSMSRTIPGNYRTQCTWLASLSGVPPGYVQVQAEVYPTIDKWVEAATSYSEWAHPVVLDYPKVKLADDCQFGPLIRNGYFMEGTTPTCLCELTSAGSPPGFAQWYTEDGHKAGVREANGSASLLLSREVAGHRYTCRPESALSQSESSPQGVSFSPRYAVGPTSIIIDITDSFPLCPNETLTFRITCKVPADHITPRPLLTIVINNATVVSNKVGYLDVTDYKQSYMFRPGSGGQQSIYCKAANEIFPERFTDLERRLPVNEPPRLAPKLKTQNGQPQEGSIEAYIPEGSRAFLTCTVEGGYPSVSNVTIVCGGHVSTMLGPYATMDLRIPDGENTLPCSCTASHVTGCYRLRTEIVLTSAQPERFSNNNNSNNNSDSSNSLSLGLGVGLGVVVAIVIILLIVFVIVHKRKATNVKENSSQRFDYNQPDTAARSSHLYASIVQGTPEPPPRPQPNLLGQGDYDLISLNPDPVQDTTFRKYVANNNESSTDRDKADDPGYGYIQPI